MKDSKLTREQALRAYALIESAMWWIEQNDYNNLTALNILSRCLDSIILTSPLMEDDL